MRIELPKFPYSYLRDDRPKRQMDYERLVEICEDAATFRQPFSDLFGRFDALEAIQRGLPKNVYFSPDDRYFVAEHGLMKCVDAFCDFSGASMVYFREFIWISLYSEAPNCPKRRHAYKVVAHELGHLRLPSHKRKLNARARKASLSMVRAAHNSSKLNLEDSISSKARNADLEEEADCFQYATLVPVTRLDGALSISKITEIYDVSKRTAYEAAMLAKDYRRALFILETRTQR